jgi:hypothetical protein
VIVKEKEMMEKETLTTLATQGNSFFSSLWEYGGIILAVLGFMGILVAVSFFFVFLIMGSLGVKP